MKKRKDYYTDIICYNPYNFRFFNKLKYKKNGGLSGMDVREKDVRNGKVVVTLQEKIHRLLSRIVRQDK